MRYRIEKDSIGELQIPAEAYYGIYSARSANNFAITKRGISRQMIKALTIVKKAAAKANWDADEIDSDVAEAIMSSCDEILNGRLHGQFITDLIQGGAGIGMHMNANEVIANRANEMLGGRKGIYEFVHPINHVNKNQATDNVLLTATKIALIKQLKKLQVELKKLQNSFVIKSKECEQLSTAENVTMHVSYDLSACGNVLIRDLKRIDLAISSLSDVNMGGIDQSETLHPKYLKKVILYLNKFSGEELSSAKDINDSTRNLDSFVYVSSILRVLATNLSKISNDIRLLAYNNELSLPILQTSLSDNEISLIIPEAMNQISFYVYGLDATITKACEAGQLESNVFTPIIFMSLFEQITSLRRGIRTLREKAIEGITTKK